MTANGQTLPSPENLVESLKAYIDESVLANGGLTDAKKPGHRVKFHWPPHPISYDFHVLPSDWTGKDSFQANGETFLVEVATTRHGVFGRCQELWVEARGADRMEMLKNITNECAPLFQRQFAINRCLMKPGRFAGHLRDLAPEDLLKLLYCEDRDVAHYASVEIETHAGSKIFAAALVAILNDQRHPNRRIAQWCVLDLFEDLPAFVSNTKEEDAAVEAMAGLIRQATDDYARTVFKAGVVLGGHLPHKSGGPLLIRCLNTSSKIGRRSAIHGLFHVVEWQPEMRGEVVTALRERAKKEGDPQLKEFATLMANDIEAGEFDHVPEPMFAGED